MASSKMSALITVLLVILVATRVAKGQSNVPSCASKLVPCANYLNSTKPPASCCDPLKEAVTKELTCLCSLYDNPSFLTGLGINVTQALELPAHCGISSDISACSKAQAPSSSTSQPPPAVPGGNNSNGAGKIAVTGLASLLLIMASLVLC